MAIINIGLAIATTGKQNTEREVLLVLKALHVTVLKHRIAQSSTEPTLVADIFAPLSPNKAWEIAAVLDQDCIAQDDNGRLELFGPKADDWKPANRDYFLTI